MYICTYIYWKLTVNIFWNYFLGDFNYHQCIKINNRISGHMAWSIVHFQEKKVLKIHISLYVKMKPPVYPVSCLKSKFCLHWNWNLEHSFKRKKNNKVASLRLEDTVRKPLEAPRHSHSKRRLQDALSSGFPALRASGKQVSIYKANYKTAKSSKVLHSLPPGLVASTLIFFFPILKKKKKLQK